MRRSAVAAGLLAAVQLVITAVLLVGFVASSRLTRNYTVQELWGAPRGCLGGSRTLERLAAEATIQRRLGDSKAARHALLPAYRPFLVRMCQLLVLLWVSDAAAWVGAWDARRKNVMASGDAWAIVLLTLDGVLPSIVAQRAVTMDAFRRSAALAFGSFAVNGALLCWRTTLSEPLGAGRVVASALLFLCAGILPAALNAAVLAGRQTTRVRLHSKTHRSAFVMHLAACLVWMASFAGRIVGNTSNDFNATPVCIWSYVCLLILIALHALLPLATHKTLVADTKFWRGLGKYNAEAHFDVDDDGRGGMRLNEIASLAPLADAAPAPADAAGGTPKAAAAPASPVGGAHAAAQPPQPPSLSRFGRGHFAPSAPRLRRRSRPEMGLEMASTKLQELIEAANRDRSMLDFGHLRIEPKVIGRGATAHVYRGSYQGEKVAVKVFNPAEITKAEIEAIGREAHL